MKILLENLSNKVKVPNLYVLTMQKESLDLFKIFNTKAEFFKEILIKLRIKKL